MIILHLTKSTKANRNGAQFPHQRYPNKMICFSWSKLHFAWEMVWVLLFSVREWLMAIATYLLIQWIQSYLASYLLS